MSTSESTAPHQATPASPGIDGHAAASGAAGATAPTSGPAHKKPMRPAVKFAIGVALLLVVIFGAKPVYRMLTTVSTDDAYVNGHVTFVAARVPGQVTRVLVDDNNRVRKGDLIVQLDTEPYEIQVALKQAAVDIARTNVNLAEDHVRGIAAQARSSRFHLERAMEDVRDQLALLKAKVAQLEVARANRVFAERDYTRIESLVGKGAVSTQDFDKAKASLDVARNNVIAAGEDIQQVRASLGLPINAENPLDVPENLDQNFSAVRQALNDLLASVAPLNVHPSSYTLTPQQMIDEFMHRDPGQNLDRIYAKLIENAPEIKESQAKLESADADLAQAKLNLRYCNVYAEISGVVTRRNVNPGNNVQAGQQLMAIRSLDEIWIDCNFKETQLAELRIGQRVECDVDMYGRRRVFQGRITGFTMGTGSTLALLPPQNATGNFIKVVQRLPVRVELTDYDADKEPLFYGLSVVPYVFIHEAATGPEAGKVLQPDFFAGPPKGVKEDPAEQPAPKTPSSSPLGTAVGTPAEPAAEVSGAPATPAAAKGTESPGENAPVPGGPAANPTENPPGEGAKPAGEPGKGAAEEAKGSAGAETRP